MSYSERSDADYIMDCIGGVDGTLGEIRDLLQAILERLSTPQKHPTTETPPDDTL